jgi:multiple sugar transport system substrate-binding protein
MSANGSRFHRRPPARRGTQHAVTRARHVPPALWLCAMALCAVTVLASCGNSKAPATAAPGYPASRPAVTLQFWYMPNGPNPAVAIKAEAARFHQLHPNITVRATLMDWGPALTKFVTSAASGLGPDVTQLGTTWVGGISAAGALRPFSAADLKGLGGRSAFLPASWTATHMAGTATITAVPWFLDSRALFYRTDVLRRLRLDPVTAFATWDSFTKTLAAIKADGAVTPLGQAGSKDWNLVHNMAPFVWGGGGGLLSKDGTTPLVGTPATFTGVDYYQRLVALYGSRALMAMDTDQAATAFAAGSTAVTILSADAVKRYRDTPNQPGLRAGWSTSPLPAGPAGRFTFLGGSNLGIWKSSRHPGAAYEWVKFLTSQESQHRYAAGTASMWPARPTAVAGSAMASDPAYRAFAQGLVYGQQYPAVAAWIDIEAALWRDFSGILDTIAATGKPMPAGQLRTLLAHANVDVRNSIAQAN